MNASAKHTVYTIGHSTHTFEEYLEILQSFGIKTVVDVRSFPGSRKFPQFNSENLKTSLVENSINYIHLKELGGRRKINKNSLNTRWRNDSFRAYADYMETDSFEKGIEQLKEIALQSPTVYMCSEAVWWRCHRSMISDVLKAEGWKVLHIMGVGKSEEHPYTSPAIVEDGKVRYREKGLFDG